MVVNSIICVLEHQIDLIPLLLQRHVKYSAHEDSGCLPVPASNGLGSRFIFLFLMNHDVDTVLISTLGGTRDREDITRAKSEAEIHFLWRHKKNNKFLIRIHVCEQKSVDVEPKDVEQVFFRLGALRLHGATERQKLQCTSCPSGVGCRRKMTFDEPWLIV